MQTFKCKQCELQVTYEPKKAPGGIGFHSRLLEQDRDKTAYLTCGNGHVNSYLVRQQTPEIPRG